MKYLITALFTAVLMTGCASSRFADGKMEDTDSLNNMVDEFTESDAMFLADSTAKQLEQCPKFNNPNQPIKTVMIDKVSNRTEEHIDLQMLLNKMQTSIVRSGKVEFVEKEAREVLDEEYNYNNSGAVEDATRKGRGKQVGVDFVVVGALTTKVQEVGKTKTLYYQLNLKVVDTERNTTACMTEEKLRKRYKKGRY